MKFGWAHYFKPTPKRIRVLGNSLVACSLFSASISIAQGYEGIAVAICIVGSVGKFLSNFFSDTEE